MLKDDDLSEQVLSAIIRLGDQEAVKLFVDFLSERLTGSVGVTSAPPRTGEQVVWGVPLGQRRYFRILQVGLVIAARSGSRPALQTLLQAGGGVEIVLWELAKYGDVALAEWVLDSCGSWRVSYDLRDMAGVLAVGLGNPDYVQFMLERGVKPTGTTLRQCLDSPKWEEYVDMLVEFGLDVHAEGKSALTLACRMQNVAKVEKLLAMGANLSAIHQQEFSSAIGFGADASAILQLLLEKAPPQFDINHEDWTVERGLDGFPRAIPHRLLREAIRVENSTQVAMLLRAGANIGETEDQVNYLMYEVGRTGDVNIAKEFLDHTGGLGMDHTFRGAAEKAKLPILEFLVEFEGLDVNREVGLAALRYTIEEEVGTPLANRYRRQQFRETAKWLLRHNCDPTPISSLIESALPYFSDDAELIELFGVYGFT
ncbi:hypothetical protein BJ742DRAFT_802494 [Cladochytrium replicatum]|nr:hypothetical protein BJ742DRAFT_802494 [Cladochytrium replicatum]